jgi:AcrR family transcriptional regulator
LSAQSRAERRAPSPAGKSAAAARRPKKRRPNVERSSDTQTKLIAAAIACLHKLGYSATTVTIVADVAKVSRGAMTHHYPTKIDLMLAVVRHVFEDEREQYKQALGTPASPRENFFAFPRVAWQVLSRPSGMAVTEILMASRSDRALASGLVPLQREIEAAARSGMLEALTGAGFVPRPEGRATQRLFVAALRGLAIDALFVRDQKEIDEAVKLLEKILHLLYPEASANARR